VQAGLRIREDYGNNAVYIVYVSWEKTRAFDLIDSNPMRFLLKPLTHDEIEKTLRIFMGRTGYSQARFDWKKGQDVYTAPINEIAFLENKKRKVIIHFIHASYLVNYDCVEAVRYDRLIISGGGGESLPISRDRTSDVKERYLAITNRRRAT